MAKVISLEGDTMTDKRGIAILTIETDLHAIDAQGLGEQTTWMEEEEEIHRMTIFLILV